MCSSYDDDISNKINIEENKQNSNFELFKPDVTIPNNIFNKCVSFFSHEFEKQNLDMITCYAINSEN